MALNVVDLVASENQPLLDCPPVFAEGSINAVMVGAGVGKSLVPDNPTWRQLLDRMAETLDTAVIAQELRHDLHVFAYVLGRRPGRQRSAEPTNFQRKVSELLGNFWPLPADNARLASCAKIFADFLKLSRTSLIIDLNYDKAVEQLLTTRGVPFVRVIGSEMRWQGPMIESGVILWKIHGTIDAPSTIVLSPTEYQLVYEVNALADELQSVGSELGNLWSIGVGLERDDVWNFLCKKPRKEFAVWCLWLSDRGPEALKDWWDGVQSTVHSATVFKSPLPAEPAAPDLFSHLNSISAMINADREPDEPLWPKNFVFKLSQHFKDRAREFQKHYDPLIKLGCNETIVSLVRTFYVQYDQLKTLLLSNRSVGLGPRWCAAVKERTEWTPETLEEFAADCARIVSNAAELCVDYANAEDSTGFNTLITSAAQAAVTHVVELAELLGVECESPRKKIFNGRVVVPNGFRCIVGSNPFEVSKPLQRNLMHIYEHKAESLHVKPPIFGKPLVGALAETRGRRLLTEDEWEAAVIALYRALGPSLRFGSKIVKKQQLIKIPPIYPWGFRFADIREYRNSGNIGVSKVWALIDGFDKSRNQYCKGGAMRDRSRQAFEISSRGFLRIGEFDEFLEAAYFYQA